jgi:hypoxanthine phosphoribosyltransferase
VNPLVLYSTVQLNMTLDLHAVGAGVNRKEPLHVADDAGYDKEKLLVPNHYKDSLDRVLIPRGLILDRIERLAVDIRDAYGDEPIHLLCILKGSRGFFSELCSVLNRIHRYNSKHINLPYVEHYIRIKSYHNTESTGVVQVVSDDLSMLVDKHVLVVEDIIDTGRTLSHFCKQLIALKPKSLKIASLLEKRTPKSVGLRADFAGFEIPDVFIVGYSLDYNERFRDLNHLSVLTPEAVAKYSEE